MNRILKHKPEDEKLYLYLWLFLVSNAMVASETDYTRGLSVWFDTPTSLFLLVVVVWAQIGWDYRSWSYDTE